MHRPRLIALAALAASVVASGCTVGTAIGVPDAALTLVDTGRGGAEGGVRDGSRPGIDAGMLPPGCVLEICDDELDDDCDGQVDENCSCIPGETSACYHGPRETRGRGACTDGAMACEDGLEFGHWGTCSGDTLPGEEACDPAEVDENCDGARNEGCECTGSEPIPCGTDVGACGAGVQTCVDGLRGECVGASGPTTEDCNAIDDDCDGMIDEALTRVCGSTVGECREGIQACVDGAWEAACSGSLEPGDEACDGLDNDCDAAIDEMLTRACGSTMGVCIAGTQTCDAASWSTCTGETMPGSETCNTLDDDCDGMTDESLSRACGTDTGECVMGTEACVAGTMTACTGGVSAGSEACDGTLDEDCDGRVDEGCGCVTGATRACGTDVGACTAGTETCSSAGAWGACAGSVSGTDEICNAIDDDCDGTIDDGLSRGCGSAIGACRAGTETCSAGAWGTCAGGIGPMLERCDGTIDEDCDGVVDDGCSCTSGATRACGTDTGACVAGRETCDVTGSFGACTGAVGPAAETCNGVDDDCDGAIDDGLARSCGSDVGECVAGSQTCSAGAWGTCLGSVGVVTEVCEGTRDEDCDGTVDDGCTCVNGSARACGSSVGTCRPGSQTCSGGAWGTCGGGTTAVTETCNALDDDCDTRTDESLSRACGTDTGACVAGTQACGAGAWGTCTGSVGPATERCDGTIDDDCDGLVDDGCNCTTGATRGCGTDTGECVAGRETCDATGNWGACTGAVGAVAETCDNRDNDCDTRTDESLVVSCGTDTGSCVAGTSTCSRGAWGACAGSVGAMTELCDGTNDENCNGLVDDGCACINGATRVCGIDTGECVAGRETCNLMGAWGSCTGSVSPTSETCNTRDDDCDTRVDEGTCVFVPPTVVCPGGMSAAVLTTVTLSGSGSDPDGGAVTYSWTVTSRPTGSTSTPSSPTSASTPFFLDAAGTYTLRFCVRDNEGVSTCCDVNVISTPPGVLHVELSWDTAYGDVDLHLLNVTRMYDDGWFTADDCYFGNRTPDWGPAGAAANPTLDRDDVDGYGPENATITTAPASGTYTVGIHNFCDRSAGGSGDSTATVRIYCMGALVGTYTGLRLDDTDDWIDVASVTWPSCAVRAINRTTNGSSILPAAFTTARHCEMSCMTDANCPAGDRCALVGGGGPPRYSCVLAP